MTDKGDQFRNYGAASIPFEENEQQKHRIQILEKNIRILMYNVQYLQYLLRMKDQDLNDTYDKMYILTEFLGRRDKRKKMYRLVRRMEERQRQKNGHYTSDADRFLSLSKHRHDRSGFCIDNPWEMDELYLPLERVWSSRDWGNHNA